MSSDREWLYQALADTCLKLIAQACFPEKTVLTELRAWYKTVDGRHGLSHSEEVWQRVGRTVVLPTDLYNSTFARDAVMFPVGRFNPSTL